MLPIRVLVLTSFALSHVERVHLTGPPNLLYGLSTRFAGDVDGDGIGDVLVYAMAASGPGPGVVFVQSGRDGGRILTIHDLDNNFVLGVPMDRAGDVNSDGHDDVIVGDAGRNRALVVSGLDGSVLHTLLGEVSGDGFGTAVRGVGDVNADGRADFMVGTSGEGVGYAKVYSGADGSVLHHFVANGAATRFGSALCAVGDVDADGFEDFAVGAATDGQLYLNPGSPPFVPPFWTDDDEGSVTVFSGASGLALRTVYGRSGHDGFGYSVDAAGDIDGDGFDDYVVGTQLLDFGGSAYARVISGANGATLRHLFDNPSLARSLVSVSGARDVNGDGVPDVLVGARSGGPGPVVAVMFSGATAQPLFRYASASFPGQALRITVDAGQDVGGDGVPDFLIGVGQPAYGAGYVGLFTSSP